MQTEAMNRHMAPLDRANDAMDIQSQRLENQLGFEGSNTSNCTEILQ